MNGSKSIKVVLYPRKDKNGLFPVKIRITENRKSKYINLKFSLEKKYWLKSTDRVSVSHPNHREYNLTIENKLKEIREIEGDWDIDRFMGKLNVLDDFEKKIEGFPKTQYHTKKKYKTIYLHLKGFSEEQNYHTLYYHDLDKEFYTDFKNYLYSNVKSSNQFTNIPSVNTINSYLKYLKTFLLERVDDGIVVRDLGYFKKLSSTGKENKKIPLSIDEIKVLDGLLPTHDFLRELLFNSLNTFMMNFWSNGLRIGDCLRLKWKNINNGVITLQMGKTKEFINIPLNENNSWRIFWYLPNIPKPYNWEKGEWYDWKANEDYCEGDRNSISDYDDFLELNFSNYSELLIQYEDYKDELEDDFEYFLSDNNIHLRGGRYSVEFDNYVKKKLKGEFPFELMEKYKKEFTTSLIHSIEMVSSNKKYRENYIFPFLKGFEDEPNLDKLNNKIGSSISLINKSLKEIGRNVGITKNITNHLSRHTLTSISKSLGTDIYDIKTMLGHRSVKQTESYVNSISEVEVSKKNVERINKILDNL